MNFMTPGAPQRAPHESPKRSRNWYPWAVVISAACAALLALAVPAAIARECVGSGLANDVGTAPHAPTLELLQRIDSARARFDHKALAAYYNQEAIAARAIATEHRKMARCRKAVVAGGRGDTRMAAHCNAIVREQEGMAAEYEGMAEGYHELAKRAQL